ncbi:MAG: UDP-N-acetylglucosamine--N-acetylmuramyl-(pentapeptide) pyrophosphoryl-undecaprenol N-acetylglucosamine transferase [Collinsella intestinalis]|nr:UDP-N-acetylglucosamine--N-acetylmuramyl-(pentapeptide) pyrophosphoryl-undecaprenol N-acetylglucosamine transferase [Collinsella intestinalis]
MTDKRQLTVAIAAGGTAGHVNPALALADELRDRGHEVHFFGESRRLEGTLVPKEGFPFHPVHVTGFDRRRPWTLVTALMHLSHEEHRLIEAFGSGELPMPDVAIGFGAYLELPLMRAAAKLGIPIALHEQNSVPGLANKRTAKSARLIALGQPAAEGVMRSCAGRSSEVIFTGNPVRSSVLEGDRSRGRVALGIPQDATVLLVFGGSLGARHVNERLASLKRELLAIEGLHVVHSTGKNGYDETLQALDLTDAEASRWRVMPYIDDMGDTLAAADLVVSRAGASSVAEIAALAVPSILVPYPLATADHQTTNARLLTDAGAAVKFSDGDIDGDDFRDELLGLLGDAPRRASMCEAARGLAQDKAAAMLADLLEGIA